MKTIRLAAMLLLVAVLLVAFLRPLFVARQAHPSAQKTFPLSRNMPVKLVPGMMMRLTLIRFTVPKDAVFTPPTLAKTAVPPRNMLKLYRDAAQAQQVTPIIHVFPALLIRDGETEGEYVGDDYRAFIKRDKANKGTNNSPATLHCQCLFFTPVIRAGGFAEVRFEAQKENYIANGRFDGSSTMTEKTIARASLKVSPSRVIRLPHSFDNCLGRGMLFVSLTPAPGSSQDDDNVTRDITSIGASGPVPEQVPVKNIALPPAAPAIPGATPIVHVQITDFDVAADLVPSVTHAMLDPVQRRNRLLAISQAADSQGRPFVITPGIDASDDPRKPHKYVPPIPGKLAPFATMQDTVDVPESHYVLHQTLHIASRVNLDGTAAADIILAEQPAKLPGDFLYPTLLTGNSSRRAFVNIPGSRTILFGDPIGTGGVVHLIFATFTLLPPGK